MEFLLSALRGLLFQQDPEHGGAVAIDTAGRIEKHGSLRASDNMRICADILRLGLEAQMGMSVGIMLNRRTIVRQA